VVEVLSVGGLGVYAERLVESGFTVRDCKSAGLDVPGFPLQLLRDLRNFAPDILHAHSGSWYPACMARGILRVPLVFTDHGRYPPERRITLMLQRLCVRFTDELIAVSPPLADYIRDVLHLAFNPRVVVNGIDLSPFEKGQAKSRELRAKWGFSDNDVVVVMLGRLEPVKNPMALLHALAKAGRDNLRAVFVGIGSLESDLRIAAIEMALERRVRFLGFRDDIADCLLASDVFAMPSNTEGLPISLLEALAAGLPVIASAVGGIPSVLGDPPAGFLIQPGDTDAFARGLARLADDVALRRELGAQGRKRISAFTIDRMTDTYESIYAQRANADTGGAYTTPGGG
jgi:glycosyltransferase involved in cell wall biosynthesis